MRNFNFYFSLAHSGMELNLFEYDGDSCLAQTLADDTATLTSTLEDFGQLKILHERTLLLYVHRGHIFLLGGYKYKKKKVSELVKTLKVACRYVHDHRLLVTLTPTDAVRRGVARAVRSRRGDIISLAEMDWPWDVTRLADLLGEERLNFDSYVM